MDATVLLVVIVLAVALGVVVGFPGLVLVGVNSDTQSQCVGVGGGFAYWGGGQFPDPSTLDDRAKVGELLSASVIYLSWTDQGTSLPFAAAGRIGSCGALGGGEVAAARYSFAINTGAGLKTFHQDDVPNGYTQIDLNVRTPEAQPYNVNARSYAIDGTTYEDDAGVEKAILDGSVLHVTLDLGLRQAAGLGACCDWYAIAWDEARLLSGIPTIQRGAEQYEVGETGAFRWEVPFVSTADGQTAYYLTLTDENTGRAVGGWDHKPLTATSGTATFPVTSDLFSQVAGARNTVRGSIYSPIFLAGVEDVTVIDDKDLAPRVTSVELNQREYREGDPVTLAITAVPNPTTHAPIARYHVLLHIGGDVLYDSDTTSPTVSAIASRTGILEGEVVAYDTSNRPSPVYEVQATVGNVVVDCEIHPELAQCGGAGSSLGLIVILVFLVLGLIFGAITGTRNPIAGVVVFVVFLIAGILLAAPIAAALGGIR